MKIRLRNNSIRVRLAQSEVRSLAAGEAVESLTPFGPGQVLVNRIAPGGDALSASLSGATVTIAIPAGQVAAWAAGGDISLEAEQTWDGGSLRLQIEKDLACATPRAGEDDSDAYPNELARTGHCR